MSNFRDGYLDAGQPLGMLPQDVILVADDTSLVLNPKTSLLRLQSDNTTAANRTFTLQPGYVVGQELVIVFTSGASTTAQLLDAGNVALSAAWTPVLNGTLRLVWTGSVWVETARSVN
jgi:hypothetical protein